MACGGLVSDGSGEDGVAPGVDSGDREETLSERWIVPEPGDAFRVGAPDGASIIVRRHGNPDGPRILLSHGNGFSADAYYPFWSRFVDRFDVFVHDVRNHGWNPVGSRHAHNVPAFVDDGQRILGEIARRFGNRPVIGVFHSLSSLVALRQASAGGGGFAALVLFDPPVAPPGGLPEDMEGIGARLRATALKRRDRFATPEVLADMFSRSPVFARVPRESIELLARTTLRRSTGGPGYELCCPREYEAQINEFVFIWSMTVDFGSVPCPVKAIGADPTETHAYMPSLDFGEILRLDYDFLPETSHLLQLEEPETCAALALEFLVEHGLA